MRQTIKKKPGAEIKRKIGNQKVYMKPSFSKVSLKHISRVKGLFSLKANARKKREIIQRDPILEKLLLEKEKILEIVKHEKEINSGRWGGEEFAKGEKDFLERRFPFFATPFPKELVQRMQTIQKVSSEIAKKYGKDYIGMFVLGSSVKGTFREKSDLDYFYLGYNAKIEKDLYNRLKESGMVPCDTHSQFVNPVYMKHFDFREIADIFRGVFFGDKKRLIDIQRESFQKIMKMENSEFFWEKVREAQIQKDIDVLKIIQRFEIGKKNNKEIDRLFLGIGLRLLPPYAEMKRILGFST